MPKARRPSPAAAPAAASASSEPTLQSLLFQAHREANSALRRVVDAEGLPVEFWRVLEVLADERGRTMSTLAEQTGMLMPAMSKLIDRMTDAALVQRSIDPADNRRVVLHISDFGLAKVAALEADLKRDRRRLQTSMTADRERELRVLLGEFIRVQRSSR